VIRLCLAAALTASSLIAPAMAGGTGPGDEDKVQAYYYCMQEAVKAAVWVSKLSGEAAVKSAYRDCRPDFSAALASLPNAKARAKLRADAKRDHAMHVAFAEKMKAMGNPNP
jgi:hypothetical protein